MFFDIYSRANAAPEFVARHKYRMSAEHDEASRLASARDEGVAEGIAQGKEESARETSLRLHKVRMSPEVIATIVDFPLPKVKEWLGIH